MKIEKLNKNLLIEYRDDIKKCLMQLESIHSELEANKMLSNINQYLDDGTAIIICAIDDAHLIGLIWAYERLIDIEKRYHINYFVIDEKHRKKGIGNKLINKIFEIAKENKIDNIELIVNSKNKNALEFYKKLKFEEEKLYLCKKID